MPHEPPNVISLGAGLRSVSGWKRSYIGQKSNLTYSYNWSIMYSNLRWAMYMLWLIIGISPRCWV